MADDSFAAENSHDWRVVALVGGVCFPASFLLFQFAVPAGAWTTSAPEYMVSAFFAALMTALTMLVAGIALTRRTQVNNMRMKIAINNMSQGLCMFDGNERLVICNQRYLELYKLSGDIVKPGCTLTALLQHRIANGSFSRDPD
ncbi:MAG TPA: PAS-domain containing protein, partial [Pseudolabrys sp.]